MQLTPRDEKNPALDTVSIEDEAELQRIAEEKRKQDALDAEAEDAEAESTTTKPSQAPAKQTLGQRIAKLKFGSKALRYLALATLLLMVISGLVAASLAATTALSAGLLVSIALGPLVAVPLLVGVGYALLKTFGAVLRGFEKIGQFVKKNAVVIGTGALLAFAVVLIGLTNPAFIALIFPGLAAIAGVAVLGVIAALAPVVLYAFGKLINNNRALAASVVGVAAVALAAAFPLIFPVTAVALPWLIPLIFGLGAALALGAAIFGLYKAGRNSSFKQKLPYLLTLGVLLGVGVALFAPVLATLLFPGIAAGLGVALLGVCAGLLPFLPSIISAAYKSLKNALQRLGNKIKQAVKQIRNVLATISFVAAIGLPIALFLLLSATFAAAAPILAIGLPLLAGALAFGVLLGLGFFFKTDKLSPNQKWLLALGVGIVLGAAAMILLPGLGLLVAAIVGLSPLVLFGLTRAWANLKEKAVQIANFARKAFGVICFLGAIAGPIVGFLLLPGLLPAMPLLAIGIPALVAVAGFALLVTLGLRAFGVKWKELKTKHKVAIVAAISLAAGALLAVGLTLLAPAALAGMAALLGISTIALTAIAVALPLAIIAAVAILGKGFTALVKFFKAVRENPKKTAFIAAAVLGTLTFGAIVLFAPVLGLAGLAVSPLVIATLAFVAIALLAAVFAYGKEIIAFFRGKPEPAATNAADLTAQQTETLDEADEITADDTLDTTAAEDLATKSAITTSTEIEPELDEGLAEPPEVAPHPDEEEQIADDSVLSTDADPENIAGQVLDTTEEQEYGGATIQAPETQAKVGPELLAEQTQTGVTEGGTAPSQQSSGLPSWLASKAPVTLASTVAPEVDVALGAEGQGAKATIMAETGRTEGQTPEALITAKQRLGEALEKTDVVKGLEQGEVKEAVFKAVQPEIQKAPEGVADNKERLALLEAFKAPAPKLDAKKVDALADKVVDIAAKQYPVPLPTWAKEAIKERMLKALQEAEERRQIQLAMEGGGTAPTMALGVKK